MPESDTLTAIDTENDTEMGGAEDNPVEIGDNDNDNDNENDAEDDLEDETTIPATQDPTSTSATANPQTNFLEFLKSPVVTLEIGTNSPAATSISAHRNILARAPYFAEALSDPDTVTISLPDEDVDAMACFLQYQYTGEYFPRRVGNANDGLETDPSLPEVDTTGNQLLKHAKVYTLAGKLGLPDLKTLAHSKIHRINSTAVGEIAYARYVYGNTAAEDSTIRKPVAAFWATRSHVLRHEAEREFKSMCLEFPQFGFDVLSLVLDAREKRQRDREDAPAEGTPSQGAGTKRRKTTRLTNTINPTVVL